MSIKLILYCIFIPFSIWIMTSTNLDKIFKKNSIMQIHSLYIALSVCLSYFIVNFLMDIYTTISLL
ncbi:MAG TPA: DUF1146 domain-containing protein [Candidatus Aphodocola excrementigallinarum]|uniref:DUF1146 domain-containing protein n=1 Tax=Candidatus Aphodocola excrementigallinarum TaxID=2840670 RepID=A0A9D1ILR5_9FIRM|nr:DUF1146 domain-containing protein [Candidatus Aphodocola excrementigallinarum]